MGHNWIGSSGTTDTCANCGCIRVNGFTSALPHSPSAFSSWDKEENGWTQPWDRYFKKEPPCLPEERGHAVPAWIKEKAGKR